MSNVNAQNTAFFQHNDFLLECWHDSQIEMNDCDIELNFDYNLGRAIFGQAVINWLNDLLKTDLKFIEVKQPHEYNFESDKIILSFTANDIDLIKNYIGTNATIAKNLCEYVREVTTYKSGYIAFYTIDQIKQDNELLIGCMLQVIHDTLNQDSAYSFDDFEGYYDRHCIYDHLLECIIDSE